MATKALDFRGLRAHRSPDDDGEVGADGDGESPATGAAITIRNVGRLARHEVGKAFGHGRIIRKEERKGFVEDTSFPFAGSDCPSSRTAWMRPCAFVWTPACQ